MVIYLFALSFSALNRREASPVHLNDKSPSKATPATPLTNQAMENIQSDDDYGIDTFSLRDST
jgi:hypothetical protein